MEDLGNPGNGEGSLRFRLPNALRNTQLSADTASQLTFVWLYPYTSFKFIHGLVASLLQEKNSRLSEVKGQKSHLYDLYITAFLTEPHSHEIYIKTQI